MKASDLHIIGAYTNPNRYKVRGTLCRKWVQESLDYGVTLYLVQHAIGEMPYEFSKDDPLFKHVNLISLRGGPEHLIWLQHALYNVGLSRLPENAKYFGWQDTDISHVNKNYSIDAQYMLQQHRVGQTWTHSVDLDPNGNIARNEWGNDVDRSFCAAWLVGDVNINAGPYTPRVARALLPKKDQEDWRSHTGYDWVARTDVFKGGIGRLLDWMIIGSGDYHLAHAFAGDLRQMVINMQNNGADWSHSKSYFRKLTEYAILCERYVKQDIGCLPGTILHGWHGSKKLRYYGGKGPSREDIIREGGFDPDTDIAYDFNGLPYLCNDNRILRDGIRRYNRIRNEDSIDVY